MKRYIDADKLKEHKFVGVQFERYSKIISDGRAKTDDEIYAYKVGYNEAIDSIADFEPTADVRQNVKGKWIKSNESALRPYMCSECGALFDVDTVLGKLSWQYCPACGAEMKGEDDE